MADRVRAPLRGSSRSGLPLPSPLLLLLVLALVSLSRHVDDPDTQLTSEGAMHLHPYHWLQPPWKVTSPADAHILMLNILIHGRRCWGAPLWSPFYSSASKLLLMMVAATLKLVQISGAVRAHRLTQVQLPTDRWEAVLQVVTNWHAR